MLYTRRILSVSPAAATAVALLSPAGGSARRDHPPCPGFEPRTQAMSAPKRAATGLAVTALALLPATAAAAPTVCSPAAIQQSLVAAGKLTPEDIDAGVAREP